MKINIHSGHNPDGKIGSGAIGFVKESTEARLIKNQVLSILKKRGHTVFDCTVDNGISKGDILRKIIEKCNSNEVDLDISIHLNAGVKNKVEDGKTTGSEVYVYNTNSISHKVGKKILDNFEHLGFRNRGVKISKNLYYLRKTKAPAILIECFFIDDKDDVNLYRVKDVANAIADGI